MLDVELLCHGHTRSKQVVTFFSEMSDPGSPWIPWQFVLCVFALFVLASGLGKSQRNASENKTEGVVLPRGVSLPNLEEKRDFVVSRVFFYSKE